MGRVLLRRFQALTSFSAQAGTFIAATAAPANRRRHSVDPLFMG
jgi:hypothetical protein